MAFLSSHLLNYSTFQTLLYITSPFPKNYFLPTPESLWRLTLYSPLAMFDIALLAVPPAWGLSEASNRISCFCPWETD